MDRKVVERLQAKQSGFICSVIISNYPSFTVVRNHFNGIAAQFFLLLQMTFPWLNVFNRRSNNPCIPIPTLSWEQLLLSLSFFLKNHPPRIPVYQSEDKIKDSFSSLLIGTYFCFSHSSLRNTEISAKILAQRMLKNQLPQ